MLGKENFKHLFNKSNHGVFKSIFIILLYLIIWFIVATIIATIITNVLNIKIHANPATNNPIQAILILPLSLVFEEAWTFVMLFIIANKIYRVTKNYNQSFWIGAIISAAIFALRHIPAYFNGNIL